MPILVVGLTFGDEGKGSVTDFLVRATSARTVVRYNGGPQAGHNVITDDGRWHCFAQLGAGSFVPGTRTLLGPDMLVELEALEAEALVLGEKGVPDPLGALTVDPDCTLVTPMHKMLCQMKEVALGERRKGTCGMGVGEAARDRRLLVRDILDESRGLERLERLAEESLARASAMLAEHPSPEMERLFSYFRGRARPRELSLSYRGVLNRLCVAPCVPALARAHAEGEVVFEGAQGALLDRRGGFSPFVTESRATFHDAARMAETLASSPTLRCGYGPSLAFGSLRASLASTHSGPRKIGVLRAYGHRHGPGPFVTEDGSLDARFADPNNPENRWQGRFRVGHLDLVALGYGIALNEGVDALAVTGLDRLSGLPTIRVCTSYVYEGDLAGIDRVFEHERLGERRARVLRIRPPAGETDGALTRAMSRCRPLEWIELPGWSHDLGDARTLAALPREARRFLDFLEDRLGARVTLVSKGPRAADKILLERPI